VSCEPLVDSEKNASNEFIQLAKDIEKRFSSKRHVLRKNGFAGHSGLGRDNDLYSATRDNLFVSGVYDPLVGAGVYPLRGVVIKISTCCGKCE
jgi:hypothetical protein